MIVIPVHAVEIPACPKTGSTWVVNAVVFSGVLLTIFLANLSALKERAPPLNVAWAALLGFILVNYLLPVQWLFGVGWVLRTLSCVVLIGGPVYFAGICFSRLFAQEPTTGYPLGINLVGVMAGGMLEYLSMLVGMKAVWLAVLAVYMLAWYATLRGQRSRAVQTG